MDQKEKELIEQALNLLNSSSHSDCYCRERDCTVETPRCQSMEVKAAVKTLKSAIDPEMRTLHPDRLTNPTERIFFEQWKKENERHGLINGGFIALEHILCPSGQEIPDRPSQRDAEVATSVLQWLGTNCGYSYLNQCERLIEQDRLERSEMSKFTVHFQPTGRERDLFQRLSDKILRDLLPVSSPKISSYFLSHIRSEIRDVLDSVFAIFAAETGLASLELCAKTYGVPLDRFKKIMSLARRSVQERVAAVEKRTTKSA